MKKILLILISSFFSAAVLAQDSRPYAGDVATIKNYDQMYAPLPHPILFVGSSSIRKWQHLQVAFGSYNVLNRGIGGAVIDDIIYYLNDLVFSYDPRQIVLYVGENDLVNESETADDILNKTKTLFHDIRSKLPDAPIVYISLKPSPSRDKYQDKCIKANTLIGDFLSKEKNVVFVDIFTPMLKDGKSRPELFVQDMLHMNPDGYAIWEKKIKHYLIKPE